MTGTYASVLEYVATPTGADRHSRHDRHDQRSLWKTAVVHSRQSTACGKPGARGPTPAHTRYVYVEPSRLGAYPLRTRSVPVIL